MCVGFNLEAIFDINFGTESTDTNQSINKEESTSTSVFSEEFENKLP
jgi:hypothetical protein